MDNIVVITQNVKLESLHLLRNHLKGKETLIFSTQLVFENEAAFISEQLGSKCIFVNFTDLMTDADFERCDVDAYNVGQRSVAEYYAQIKLLKNQVAVERLLKRFPCSNRLMVCDDLGIDEDPWFEKGFKKVNCEYYHIPDIPTITNGSKIGNLLKAVIKMCKKYYQGDIYIAHFNQKKYLFFGSLSRIGYRFNIDFEKASKWENIKFILGFFWCKAFKSYPKNNTIRMSTLHESTAWPFPHHSNMNVKIIQDGYLPPNYSSKYLLFHGPYTEFYTWDKEGRKIFEYHQLKNRVIPFRKKLYLPEPCFPKQVKKVLCVASGAGDWTALKNRSNEDSMIEAFGKVAALFPDIEFIYRCHPVWIHPQHQGVNSINRAAEYIHWLNLPNLKISSNIPNAEENGKFRLSYKRTSFEEDLKDVDLVFGEHSISMIDAAFKQILFGSVNVTGRRDLVCGISAMGFPHCESVDEIALLIKDVITPEFRGEYLKAVKNYNDMTDKEE